MRFDGVIFDADDLCLLRCVDRSCPDLYECEGGVYCTYTGLRVRLDPPQPIANQPITFTAEVPGETPAEDTGSWLFSPSTADGNSSANGMQTTQTFDRPGSLRVTLTVGVRYGEFGVDPRQQVFSFIVQ